MALKHHTNLLLPIYIAFDLILIRVFDTVEIKLIDWFNDNIWEDTPTGKTQAAGSGSRQGPQRWPLCQPTCNWESPHSQNMGDEQEWLVQV